ncbi:hypothetical protein AtubIFM57258_006841 [Aspergillus tubingensis]|nr:hypothetical protein AtubIFM57258_006841 [Aspergillus tubingensis]
MTLAEIREYVPQQTKEETEDENFGQLIPIMEFDDDGEPTPPNVAVQKTFRNSAFQIGTTGLVGCTVVTVVSRRAVYMGHFWEDPNWEDPELFVTTILNFISNTDPRDGSGPALNPALFNQPNDDTRIYIMHPRADDKEDDYTAPYYPEELERLKTLLNQQLLPGIPTATWIYIPVNWEDDEPDPLADQPWRRHAIFQYDPHAHSTGRRKKGWRLFYEDHYFDDTNPPPGPESANGIPAIP